MSTQNKALIRRWFEEVWNKRRVDDLNGPAGFKPFHGVLGPEQLGVVNPPTTV